MNPDMLAAAAEALRPATTDSLATLPDRLNVLADGHGLRLLPALVE